MGKVGEALRRKAVIGGVAAAALAVGVGVGSAVALSPTSTAPVSDQTQVTQPAPTSQADEPTTEPAPTTQAQPVVQQPVEQAPADTVPAVTSSQQEPATTEPDPAKTGIGTIGPDGAYTPAPPPERPGQPPMGSVAPPLKVEPLPGEPGYNGPVQVPSIPSS